MYIEQITIHFTTKKAPMKVFGAEAQRVFDEKAYEKNTVEVTIDGDILAIPRESILFVEIKPNKEANELNHEIDLYAREIAEKVIEDDPVYKKEGFVILPPEEWELSNDEQGIKQLLIGYFSDGDIPIITKDKKIIRDFYDLSQLIEDLEKVLAGDRNVN